MIMVLLPVYIPLAIQSPNNESLQPSSVVALLNQYMTWGGQLWQHNLSLGLVMQVVGSESKMTILTYQTGPILGSDN